MRKMKIENLEIELSDDGSSLQIANASGIKTNPIEVDKEPAQFAEWLGTTLLKMKQISSVEPFTTMFTTFLTTIPVGPIEQAISFGEEPIPTATQETEGPIVVDIPETGPEVAEPEIKTPSDGIMGFVVTGGQPQEVAVPKEELKVQPQKSEQGEKLAKRFQELLTQYKALGDQGLNMSELIFVQMEKETGIDRLKVIKIVADEIRARQAEMIDKKKTIGQVKQVEPPIITPPTTVLQIPQVPQAGATVVSDIVKQELMNLPQQQKDLLQKEAEYYKVDVLSFAAKCVADAEKAFPPTHWLARAYKIGRSLGFVISGESVLHAIFGDATGNTYEVAVKKDLKDELKVDQCYKIPFSDQPLRCIARSGGAVSKDYLPNAPVVESITPVQNVEAIPKSVQFLRGSMIKLSDAYYELKKRETHMALVVVAGQVENSRSPKKGLWYFNINDGSLKGVLRPELFSVEMIVPNPFGIDENMLRTSEGKDVFVYGLAHLSPPSEKFSRDSIKIKPMYIAIE